MKLAELVSRLHKAAPHVDAEYLRRQVRYWTATGLVGEEEELQDQPRRHRGYDTRHLYRAALLVEFARYGMPRRIMQQVVEEISVRTRIYSDKHDSDPFEDAINGTDVTLIFCLLHGRDGQPFAQLRIGRTETDEITLPFPASWITISLIRVLAPLT